MFSAVTRRFLDSRSARCYLLIKEDRYHPDKAKPFGRRARNVTGLPPEEEDGRAAEGLRNGCPALLFLGLSGGQGNLQEKTGGKERARRNGSIPAFGPLPDAGLFLSGAGRTLNYGIVERRRETCLIREKQEYRVSREKL
jgi:hypothetical protein